MAKAQYTEEQFKDFGDFYAYTDVFDCLRNSYVH